MVAHITAPALEPDPSRVATNSNAIVTGILKQQLGFKGLVITDAMDMGGLTSVYPEGGAAAARHAALDTLKAGNDISQPCCSSPWMSFEETTIRVCDLGSLPLVPLTALLLPIFW
jgi:beta-glucosidase-like glycosyl hydrolase